MATLQPLVRQEKFGATSRRDAWWLSPLLVLLGLSAFLIYGTWAAWQGNYFEIRQDRHDFAREPNPAVAPYLSPVLLAVDLRSAERACLGQGRFASRLDAHLVSLLGRFLDPGVPRAVPVHLLLLPQSLLPGLLGRPARLCGRRAAQELLGREPLAVALPERRIAISCTSPCCSSSC